MQAAEQAVRDIEVPVVPATREAVADYGLYIGTEVPQAGLGIPFYKGAVEEGHNFAFSATAAASSARPASTAAPPRSPGSSAT
ncbi:hypothetical protein [Nannocystis punicea]|uniref:Uncharacterized protein n=1 Tax=Nannocystis punicea TaxID=2995304 RepID=A0ABY7H1X4_9BACT|nr:hypothetical protein [Nannocystis poenicansa]WAS93268.1 hypothetical protein O0S08_44535 [Nannocystis poenicansa]